MLHLKGRTANRKTVRQREIIIITYFLAVQIATAQGVRIDDFFIFSPINVTTNTTMTTITAIGMATNIGTHGPSESSLDSCGIPAEGSNKLDQALQNASMKFLTMVDNDSKDEPRDLCTSLMTYIMTQAKYMLQQAKFLADIALENNRTFEILKEGYKIELAQFAAIMNKLNKDHREEISAIENGFNKKFIQFQKIIGESLDQLDILLILKKEAAFELCVSKIRNGEYQSALASFKKLGNNSQLTKIATRAYGGEIDKLANVIKFIKVAESCDHQALAYQALFDEIKINDHLSHPNVLFFSDLIDDCISETLKNELKEYKTNIIKALVYEFKLEKIIEALDFEKKFPADEASVKFEIYSTLFDELESRGHLNSKELIALAFRVKQLDDFCKGKADVCKYLKPKLSSMKLRFPSGLKALVFDPHVVIESKRHPGYSLYTSSMGDVYTAPNSNSSNQKWLAKALTDGNYIQVENMVYEGNLHVSGSILYLGENYGSGSHWEVIPEENGSYYFLKNRQNGEFIDANDLYACTWSDTGLCGRAYTKHFEIDNTYEQWTFS